MRSVRLDPELDRQVRRAAEIEGESVSEFIRRAVAKQAEETLMGSGRERFVDVASVVHGGGGRARRSGAAFVEALAEGRSRR
jgi:hypothetical protein